MSEWKECKLGDIAIITDCEHKTAPLVDSSEFISVRTSNIQNGKIDFENSNRVSYEVYEEWTKRLKPNVGDIVLAREAPVGEVGWIPKGKKVCLGQRTVLIRTTDKSINPKYLLYYLVNDEVKNDLINRSTGSVVEHLNVKDIKNFDLRIHNLLEEQGTIASVLTSLDDKIDLLHRQNATLEAMAETLFRQWFVEDAKEDWEEITLFDAIDLIGGGTPKTSMPEYWHGNIKWLSGGDIANNHKSIIISSEKSITELGLKNSSAKLLPKFSTIISARGTVGKYCILSEPMTFSQSNYGIKPKYENCYFFTYLLIAYSVDELISAAYGSVFDTITTDTFKGHSVTLPKINIIKDFELEVTPLFKKMLNNQTQIRTLTALRDTLLPKLMSGEIRVIN